MKKKPLEVLSYLHKQTDWATASEIAIAVNCSARSVKTYIADLNAAYPELITASRKGFSPFLQTAQASRGVSR